jgi:hypothetical protein
MKKLRKITPAPTPAPAPEPTLEERLAATQLMASAQLGAFVRAAEGLEKAAGEFDTLGAEYAAVADVAASNKVTAEVAAIQHRNQAQSIRNLIGN